MAEKYWTNERHVHFLNSMEASFVKSMFENKNNNNNGGYGLRLDRYLPDTSESTQDLPKETRMRRHSTSDIIESSGARIDRKTRILSSHKSSQDQVVPQFQKKRDGKDRDEKDFSMG